MTIDIHVAEIDRLNYKHNRYIRFDLDNGKKFCYRSRVSYSAFFKNHKKKRNQTKQFLYTSKGMNEFQIDLDVWAKSMEMYPGLTDIYSPVPVVTVKNLWDFYKLVGYDYKTKKWTV